MSYYELITIATIKGVMVVEADSEEEALKKGKELAHFADPQILSDEQGYEEVEVQYARELVGNDHDDLGEDYIENLEANEQLLEEAAS